MCGKLLKSMYGTLEASLNWEEEYVRFMLSIGFISEQSSPCWFNHPGKDIRAVVYGDSSELNIILTGVRCRLKELTYAIDFKARLGPHEGALR